MARKKSQPKSDEGWSVADDHFNKIVDREKKDGFGGGYGGGYDSDYGKGYGGGYNSDDQYRNKKGDGSKPEGSGRAETDEANKVNGLFSGDDHGGSSRPRRKIRSYVTKKRAAATGGILGAILSVFGISSIMQGPGQFMHIASFLKNAHLSIPDKFNEDFSGRFVVYALSGKSAEGRLGAYANRRANKWEKRLNANGMKSVYQVGTQRGIGIQITDPVKAEPFIREMRARGYPIDSEFRSAIDINRNRIDGVRGVNTSGLSFRQRNHVTRAATRSLKINRVSSWLGGRLLIRRSGTDGMFHPFRNRLRRFADNFALTRQERRDAENEREEARKEEENRHRTGDVDTDIGNTRLGRFRSRLAQIFRLAKGPAAVVVTICAAKNFSDSIDAQNYENQLTMLRMAATALGRGDQTQAFSISHPDLSMGEYALAAENLYNPENDTSWVADPGVQSEMGLEPVGRDYIEEGNLRPKSDKPAAFDVVDAIPTGYDPPGLGSLDVCSVVSEAGEIVSNAPLVGPAMDWVDDRISDVVSAATGKGTDEWIQTLRDQFASSVASTDFQGSIYGGAMNIGGRIFARTQSQMTGARPLTEAEENNLEIAAAEERQFVLAQQGFSKRHLDITNIDSTAGRLAFNAPKTRSELVASIAKIPTTLASFFTKPFSNKADAQSGSTEYDYGFKAMGFSQAELSDERFENPFEVGQYYLDHPEELEQMNNEYGKDCFAMTISPEGDLQYETVEEDESLIELPEKCSETVLGANSDDVDGKVLAAHETNLLRYRYLIAYTVTSHTLDCYEGLSKESCDQLYGIGVGSDAGGGGGPVNPATGCPDPSPGNNPSGDIMVTIGNITNVHPCIEENVRRMVEAAAADGITLSGNAYRSEDRQIELYIQNCGSLSAPTSACSPPTATPGNSQHNVGTAIDMNDMCFPRSTCVGNANYDWLVANAGAYGFQKLSSEAWHWSINGN